MKKLLWLPLDSRILPHIFSFGHVKGMARIFMTIEILLATFVVIGTLVLVILHALY